MTLPDALRVQIEEELDAIRRVDRIGGGCIHPAYRVELADRVVFVKHATTQPFPFAAESAGLALLAAAAEELRVPRVLRVREGPDGGGWLALEWLEPASRPRDFGERLGRGLASMHRMRGADWGWDRDGFIGSLPQANGPTQGWAEFWWTRRLEPQLRLARDRQKEPGATAAWERLAGRLPDLLEAGEREGPSLLHGDLWGGNVLSVAPGDPALVDPAVYYGHREVDLAMTELFGGFDPAFYAAYDECYPRIPGYQEARRDVYQLYFLLVHVNLFGGSYVGQASATLRRLVGG